MIVKHIKLDGLKDLEQAGRQNMTMYNNWKEDLAIRFSNMWNIRISIIKVKELINRVKYITIKWIFK